LSRAPATDRGCAFSVGSVVGAAVADDLFVVFGIDGGTGGALAVFTDLFVRAFDIRARIVGASAFQRVARLVFTADDLCARVGLASTLVAELLGATGGIFAGVIDASAVFAAFSTVTRNTCTGLYAVSVSAEATVWTSFAEARVGFTFALSATLAVFATFAVTVLFHTNTRFADKVVRAFDAFAGVDTLSCLAGRTCRALDICAGVICAFPFCVARLAVGTSDVFAWIVFALAHDTDLAARTLGCDTRIGFTSPVDTALCGGALDCRAGRDALSVTAKGVGIARNRLARIGFALALSATFALFASEVITIVLDTFSVFAGFSSVTAYIFAEVFALAVFAAKAAWAADQLARIFGTTAIDANAACGTGDVFARIADALADKADLTSLTGNPRTGVFFALSVVAGLACRAGRAARCDTLAFGTSGTCGTLDSCARVRDTLAAHTDLVAWAAKGITVGGDALAFPTSESCGALEDAACVDANAALAELAVFASDICTRSFGNTDAVGADFSCGTFSVSASIGALSVSASCTVGALYAFVHFSVAVVVESIADLSFGLAGEAGAEFAAFALLDARSASGGARADQVFVDQAVAVVVFAVADLDSGFEGSDTKLPVAVDALLFSGVTKGLASAFFAFFALCSAIFVDLAVAIVVCVVAAKLFFGGFAFTDASAPYTVCAGLFASLARSDAFGACGAAITRAFGLVVAFAIFVFVDLAVAIVVFAVANFGGRFRGGAFAPCAVGAVFESIAASGLASATDAFVDAAVAVVVFAIADFGGWEDFACTSAPCAVGTGLCSRFAVAFSCRSCGTAVAGFGLTFFAKT